MDAKTRAMVKHWLSQYDDPRESDESKREALSVWMRDHLQMSVRAARELISEAIGVKHVKPKRQRRANPHRRRRVRPTLRSMMHVRRGARGLSEREARRLAQFEKRYDRLVGHSRNPRKRRRVRHRAARRANPRSPLFKLLAQRRGGKRLVYLGGVKFAEKGRPVYFKTPEGARTLAKLLKLQFPVLKRYAFAVAGA
jgi:hypothetical protein